jgi:peptidoglycan hydrolase-like protein with peptidoglycan-binding domain
MKLLLFATALLAATVAADDRVRDVQAELKSQGFFYGTADGKEGPETTAAIRRFQIRNGLEVTGGLNEQTLGALGIGENPAAKPGDPAAPKEAVPKAPVKESAPPAKMPPQPQFNPPVAGDTKPAPPPARNLLREPKSAPDADDTSRPPRPRVVPDDPGVISPPRSLPPAMQDDWTTFYHGTPYATAPRELQINILRKAQQDLARRRLFRAIPDGLPGAFTSEALFLYQEQRRLPRTGRLDLQTLAALELLPGRGPDAPPLKPFYNPNRRRDRSVDQPGIIR